MTKEEKNKLVEEYIKNLAKKLNSKHNNLFNKKKINDLINKYLDSNKDYETIIDEINEIFSKQFNEYINDKKLEEEFITSFKELNIKKSNKDKFFGQSLKSGLCSIFEIYEKINSDVNLSIEEKSEKFNTLKNNFLKEEKQRIKNLIYKQLNSKNERKKQNEINERFNGLNELNYSTTRNLYNNFINDFNIIVPEVEGKIYYTVLNDKKLFIGKNEVNPEIFDFSEMEKVFTFAKKYNKKLRLHPIIFNCDLPEILETEIKNKDKEEQERICFLFLESYFSNLSIWAKNNKFHFTQIDIINEILSDKNDNNLLKNNKWNEILNENYYINLLKIGKKYFPNSDLILNECNEFLPNKCNKICDLVEKIQKVEKEENIKLLDGLGLESHFKLYIPEYKRNISINDIFESSLTLSELKLPLYRTEFYFNENRKKSDYSEELKEKILNAIYLVDKICDFEGFISWGNSDLICSNSVHGANATLIDKNGIKKPMYYKFRDENDNKYKKVNEYKLIKEKEEKRKQELIKQIEEEKRKQEEEKKKLIYEEISMRKLQPNGFINVVVMSSIVSFFTGVISVICYLCIKTYLGY